MTVSATLPAAIRESHDRIEQLPIALAMANGTIDRPQYRRLLAQMRKVHAALETALEAEPRLAGLYQPAMARAADVMADLFALGEMSGEGELLPPTATFAEKLRREWAGRPAALAGCLYVLEGSRMGSMFLSRPLAKALGVPMRPGAGLDYHIRDIDCRPILFKQFKVALDAVGWNEAEAEELREAAVETMEALYAIYAWAGEPAEATLTGACA